MSQNRRKARELAKEYINQGKPMEWFEELYLLAKAGEASVPWADMEPNPNLVDWLERENIGGSGKTALKIGCGLGDDVEALSEYGFLVTGFDISPAAIEWCMRRFPASEAGYAAVDLFNTPSKWNGAFDFVLESYTLQVLPPDIRWKAIKKISGFTAPGGTLLAIARGREPDDDPGQMPWPLTKEELLYFVDAGLALISFEDFLDEEVPPVRRFRAEFHRPKGES